MLDRRAAELALARIEKDIRNTTELRDKIHLELTPSGLGVWATRDERVIGGGTVTFEDDDDTSISGLAAALADVIQHAYVMEALFRAWPKCPDHDHILEAAVKGRRGVWACPQGGRASEIGNLGAG